MSCKGCKETQCTEQCSKDKPQTTKKKPKIKTKPGSKPRPIHDWVLTDANEALAALPIDYTFKNLQEIEAIPVEEVRLNRFGLLQKGRNLRLISRSLWLNHNNLSSLQNLHVLANKTLEYPELLGFLDLSCNKLTDIHSDLYRFPNITVLYLHGNQLNDPKYIYQLRKLSKLQHLTIYANPWCDRTELGQMRKLVAAYLPKLSKLDHNKFTPLERNCPLAANALKILRELNGKPPDWLFKKFPIPKMTPEIQAYCDAKEADKK